MSQRPDSVLYRPEGVSQRPGSVPQRPDFLRFLQDIQDVSAYSGGVTARLRRALAPCRTSTRCVAELAGGRWLYATKRRGRFKSSLQGAWLISWRSTWYFRVSGKSKESVCFVPCKAEGNRLESPVLSWFQRDSADCAAIARQLQINSDEIAVDSNFDTCRKHGCDAGRMCEVGPPAQRAYLFTGPYSRRAALNGHPALRGRPATAGTTGIEK